MKKPQVQIVPASPGWHVVESVIGENDEVVDLALIPVVAWAVELCRAMETDRHWAIDYEAGPAVPITCERSCNSTEDLVLREPGGLYRVLADRTLQTKEQVIEHFSEKWRKERERLARKKAERGGGG